MDGMHQLYQIAISPYKLERNMHQDRFKHKENISYKECIRIAAREYMNLSNSEKEEVGKVLFSWEDAENEIEVLDIAKQICPDVFI